MFYSHLKLTKNEAVTMIQKNYQMDIEIFDEIEGEILTMSDYIAAGLLCSFIIVFNVHIFIILNSLVIH